MASAKPAHHLALIPSVTTGRSTCSIIYPNTFDHPLDGSIRPPDMFGHPIDGSIICPDALDHLIISFDPTSQLV
ncbi:MAG: hypothetical protein H6633_28945 [Anaerolineales bacterium]|nr:hypothetical protein [Anaerolineales bacterium]